MYAPCRSSIAVMAATCPRSLAADSVSTKRPASVDGFCMTCPFFGRDPLRASLGLELESRRMPFDADRDRVVAHALLVQAHACGAHPRIQAECEREQLVDARLEQRSVLRVRPVLRDPSAQRLVVDALAERCGRRRREPFEGDADPQ